MNAAIWYVLIAMILIILVIKIFSERILYNVFMTIPTIKNNIRLNIKVLVYNISNNSPEAITKIKYFLSLLKYGYIITNAIIV